MLTPFLFSLSNLFFKCLEAPFSILFVGTGVPGGLEGFGFKLIGCPSGSRPGFSRSLTEGLQEISGVAVASSLMLEGAVRHFVGSALSGRRMPRELSRAPNVLATLTTAEVGGGVGFVGKPR